MTNLIDIGKDARWKLSPIEHLTIKLMYQSGNATQKQLTEYYGVSHQNISKIIDETGTKEYWSKLTAKRNLKKYRTSPKYRKQCAIIKSKIWYKRKKLKI